MLDNTCMWFDCRLKAEIEKLKLEFEESATHEQQKHSNEIKVSWSFFLIMNGICKIECMQGLHDSKTCQRELAKSRL